MARSYSFYNVSILILLSVISFSCAKKGSNIRAVKQTESVQANPAVSAPSQQAAQVQKVDYAITSLERPEIAQGSEMKTIKLEIRTPDQRYLPVETVHTDKKDSFGTFNDEQNQVKLDIRARCEGELCQRYLLLVTVVKQNYAIHQLAAVSYRSDCRFNLENINFSVQGARMYASLDDLSQRNTIQERNDCPIEE